MFAPRGWIKRPAFRRIYQAVAGSDFFNKSWYRKNNMGPLEKVSDPVWHYITSGWKKGLNPSPLFDTNYYLSRHADVASLGINPLFHFVEYGYEERRAPIWPSRQFLDSLSPSSSALRMFLERSDGQRVTLHIDENSARHPIQGFAPLIETLGIVAKELHIPFRVLSSSPSTGLITKSGPVDEWLEVNKTSEKDEIPYVKGELWIATSWSSVASVESVLGSLKLVYLMCRDEASEAAPGILRVRAEEVREAFRDKILAFDQETCASLRTQQLVDLPPEHFLVEEIEAETVPSAEAKTTKTISVFGSPHVPSTLFHRLIEVLESALGRGVLSSPEWSIRLYGEKTPSINIINSKVIEGEELSPKRYIDVLKNSDIVVALSSGSVTAPIILDALSLGVVAVTNDSGLRDPAGSGPLFSSRDLGVEGLTDALEKAIEATRESSLSNPTNHRVTTLIRRPSQQAISFLRDLLDS